MTDSAGPDKRATPVESSMSVFSRRETKYELEPDTADDLRRRIASVLPCYEFLSGQPSTYITTVYFDTDRLEFFRRASRSYDNNLKIRLKEYYYHRDSEGSLLTFPYCFVEIKQRVQGLVVKRRIRIPKFLTGRLLAGDDIWTDLVRSDPGIQFEDVRDTYDELRRYLAHFSIHARSIIHYRRSVYQENEEELRVTFDDRLKIYPPVEGLYDSVDCLSEQALGRVLRSIPKVIMEIKCQGKYPDWLKDALRNILPRRISKFTTSMNLLARQLPRRADGARGRANGEEAEPPGGLHRGREGR